MQCSRVACIGQAGFIVFGEAVQVVQFPNAKATDLIISLADIPHFASIASIKVFYLLSNFFFRDHCPYSLLHRWKHYNLSPRMQMHLCLIYVKRGKGEQ